MVFPKDSLGVQLSAEKRIHVFHDGSLTDEAREMEMRRYIWLEVRRSLHRYELSRFHESQEFFIDFI